ncbi:hypothetical protein ONZ45_g11341 [Pleurotus djamor]|nr:hypothetical protein ONZ45_g11341 [Pleurotus djamor]
MFTRDVFALGECHHFDMEFTSGNSSLAPILHFPSLVFLLDDTETQHTDNSPTRRSNVTSSLSLSEELRLPQLLSLHINFAYYHPQFINFHYVLRSTLTLIQRIPSHGVLQSLSITYPQTKNRQSPVWTLIEETIERMHSEGSLRDISIVPPIPSLQPRHPYSSGLCRRSPGIYIAPSSSAPNLKRDAICPLVLMHSAQTVIIPLILESLFYGIYLVFFSAAIYVSKNRPAVGLGRVLPFAMFIMWSLSTTRIGIDTWKFYHLCKFGKVDRRCDIPLAILHTTNTLIADLVIVRLIISYTFNSPELLSP